MTFKTFKKVPPRAILLHGDKQFAKLNYLSSVVYILECFMLKAIKNEPANINDIWLYHCKEGNSLQKCIILYLSYVRKP